MCYTFSCRKFLRENLYYDEVLAVNVAGQTGLWEILQFLASFRGLHPEVLDILTKIVRSLGEGLMKAAESMIAASKRLPALDCKLHKIKYYAYKFCKCLFSNCDTFYLSSDMCYVIFLCSVHKYLKYVLYCKLLNTFWWSLVLDVPQKLLGEFNFGPV
jgi:hypothetical protein